MSPNLNTDRLMRRAVVRLRAANDILDHSGDDRRQASKLIEEVLADLHDAAEKLRAVRRELGEPEAKP